MLSIIKSMSLKGLEGYIINVQVDVSSGLPDWEIVGLPDTSVKESKERVRTAIKNTGYGIFSKRILVNLAPANIRKEGSYLDLPIALGVLFSMENIKISKKIENTVFIGELSLDGRINKINGILPICIEAKRLGVKEIIIPKGNLQEMKSTWEEVNKKKNKYNIDFSDVKGQESVKRALEIVAAGGHNILLIGSPGARKNNASTKAKYNTSRLKF